MKVNRATRQLFCVGILVAGGQTVGCESATETDGTGAAAGAPDDGEDGEGSGGRRASGGRASGGQGAGAGTGSTGSGAGGSGADGSGAGGSGAGGSGASGSGASGNGVGGQGGAPDLPDTLTSCNMGGALSFGGGDELLPIDDFDDDDAVFQGSGLNGGWYAYGDGTDGTLSHSEGLVPVSGGVHGGALRVQAGGFTAWGSVFGAYLSEGCLYDGSALDGLTFYAKGQVEGGPSQELSVRLVSLDDMPPEQGGTCESDCWNSHHVDIEVGDCWRRYSFRFDEFLRDGQSASSIAPSELYLIDFALGTVQSSDVWLDEISFFVGDAPPAEEICVD